MTVEIKPVSKIELWRMVEQHWPELTDLDRQSLSLCLRMTLDIWAGIIDDDLVCAFGVAPTTMVSNAAYIWVWTTKELSGNEFVFIRQSQLVIERLLLRFPILYGLCEARAEQSKRWLRFLGAHFGPNRGGWAPFEIRAA